MADPTGDASPRRLRSREQLLGTISEHAPVSRAELAHATGLSRSAITDGVLDLLRLELVTEVPRAPDGSPGRPSTLLVPAAPRGVVGGMDFGHQHLAVAVARVDGQVLAERRRAVNVEVGPTVALDTACTLLDECLRDAQVKRSDLLGVAVGVPGRLDLDTGRLRSPTILSDWDHVDPWRELSARFGVAIELGNDADMGAEGERRFGAARGCRDFIYVKASHGVGAGLVLGGERYRGTLGIAGEIGHTFVRDDADRCRCGNRGCLETIASVTAVKDQLARARISVPPDPSLAEVAGDPVAAEVITEAGRTLGYVLANLCNCLNPEAILLGGELATAGDVLLRGVRESIDRYALSDTASVVSIRLAGLGLRSEVLGAVAVAGRRFGQRITV